MPLSSRLVALAALPAAALASSSAASWSRARCGPSDLVTPFGAAVAPPFSGLRAGYPRPMMVRGAREQSAPGAAFATLHGLWQFEHPRNGSIVPVDPPFGRALNGSILVPFPPEACLSGVGYLSEGNGTSGFPDFRTLWYRLLFDTPPALIGGAGGAFALHFDAVDWNSTVWLNGALLGTHSGGYARFEFDVTAALKPAGNELILFAYDPTEQGPQPQGKQAIKVEGQCGAIGNKYVPSSGIWGPVWLERTPVERVQSLRMRTNATSVALTLALAGFAPADAVNVSVSLRGAHVADFIFAASDAAQPLVFTVPGAAETWTAESPTLYDAIVTVASADGARRDAVETYFGLRSVALDSYERPVSPALGPLFNFSLGGVAALGPFALPAGASWRDCEAMCAANANCTGWILGEPSCGGRNATPTCTLKPIVGVPLVPEAACSTAGKMAVPGGAAARPLINGAPAHFSGMLDQQWWPDGLYSAPSDEALLFELQQAKRLGFNAVRMHTKVATERWYEAADRLGVYVLQDAVQKFDREGYPSSPDTVPFFMSDFAKAVDQHGSHPAIVQWTLFNEGDCVSEFDVASVVSTFEALDGLTSPHGLLGMGRLIDTNSGGPADKLGLADVHDVHSYPYPAAPLPSATQYAEVGEYGGLGVFVAGHSWRDGACYTYLERPTPQAFVDSAVAFLGSLAMARDLVSAAILTQATDVECECDGLMNYDRSLKFDDAQTAMIAKANAAFLYGA